MSRFLKAIRGGAKSNTIRGNGVLGGILAWLMTTPFIESNPEYLAILSAVTIIFNMIQRFRTTKPLSER